MKEIKDYLRNYPAEFIDDTEASGTVRILKKIL